MSRTREEAAGTATRPGAGSHGAPSGDPTTGRAPRSRLRWAGLVAALALLGVLALGAGAVLGSAFGGWGTPGEDSVEAGFARDMSQHHAQAVEMSMIMREKTDDPTLSALAYDVATAQAHQQGQMFGWLRNWDLPIARHPDVRPMEWMAGHAGHEAGSMAGWPDGRMAGMASAQELQQLREAEGVEAEILFLQLMTRHHIGGVEMAQAALDLAANEQVLQLAESMVAGQRSEIDLMVDLLADRGAEVDPESAAWIESHEEEPAGGGSGGHGH